MIKQIDRKNVRARKHARVRRKISGTAEKPRLSVYRSSKHIYAQLIDDVSGTTLAHSSSLDPDVRGDITNGSTVEAAKAVGRNLAERALDKDIKNVVFDRGGYVYHGRIQALADAAREAGLQF